MHLVLPEPQPTELIDSILLRVARVNGFASWPELARSCPSKEPGAGRGAQPKVVPLVGAVCRLYGWPEERVIRRHTMISYQQAFTRWMGRKRRDDGTQFRLSQFGGAEDLADHPRFCPSCLAEDRKKHGFSFLRRQHQILGVTVCTKHQVSLHQARFDPLRVLPEEAAAGEVDVLQQTPLSEIGWRFHQVTEDLLERPRPHRIESVCVALRERAQSRGFTTSSPDKLSPKSLGVQVAADMDQDATWVQSLMQGVCRKGSKVAAIINNALIPWNSRTTVIVVAALLLADSVDDAFSMLSRKVELPDTAPLPVARSRSDKELRRAYVKVGGRFWGVKKVTGLSMQTVKERMNRLGLPSLARLESSMRQALCLVAQGMPLAVVIEKTGVDPLALEKTIVHAAQPNLKSIFGAALANGS